LFWNQALTVFVSLKRPKSESSDSEKRVNKNGVHSQLFC
jgi:hypothetical protein